MLNFGFWAVLKQMLLADGVPVNAFPHPEAHALSWHNMLGLPWQTRLAFTSTCSDPELAALLPSPPYAPVIEMPPVLPPVTVTLQLPKERVQVNEENVALPAPFSDHVTVPVGFVPVTVAVQVDVPDIAGNESGLHDTDVDDERISRTAEPEVAPLLLSPP